jgi:hypothetical protein
MKRSGGRGNFKIVIAKGAMGERDDDVDEDWAQIREFDRDEFYASE